MEIDIYHALGEENSFHDEETAESFLIDDESLIHNEDIPLINNEEVRIYTHRWFILFIYALNNMMNGMVFMSLSGINNIASKYYNVSSVSIEWLGEMMLLGYIMCALPASYFISKWGVRPLLIVSACLHSLTTIIHYIAYHRDKYWLVALGQMLSAIGSSAILQVPGRLSYLWFPEDERATATSLGVLANLFGVAVGFMLPTFMVTASSDVDVIERGFKMFYLCRMVICIAILILTFAYKEQPPTPPTAGSQREIVTFKESVKLLWNNKYFIFLSQSFGIYYGLYVAIAALINPLVTSRFPNGYESTIGWMGFCNNIAAIFSFILIGRLLDKYHKYQITSILLNLFSMFIWLIFFVVLTNTHEFTALFALFVLMGTCYVPFYVVAIEQAAEITYPVPAEISSTIIIVLSNAYGIIFIFALGTAAQNGYIQVAGYVIVVLYCISTVLASLVKTELKRLNAENIVS